PRPPRPRRARVRRARPRRRAGAARRRRDRRGPQLDAEALRRGAPAGGLRALLGDRGRDAATLAADRRRGREAPAPRRRRQDALTHSFLGRAVGDSVVAAWTTASRASSGAISMGPEVE